MCGIQALPPTWCDERLTGHDRASNTKTVEMHTVAETLKNPAYPTATWDLEPDREGLLPLAEGRGGPFNVSWEIHGTGPIKIVVSRLQERHIEQCDDYSLYSELT